MKILAKAFETIRSIFYLPKHVSDTRKIEENLLRVENKLDLLIQQVNSVKLVTSAKDMQNHFLQIESLFSIYNSLPNIKSLPATRGWAGSPDFLAKVAEIVLKEKTRFVVEAGSGTSTVVIGLALKLNNYGRAISLDHEIEYSEATIKALEVNEIEDFIAVKHCLLRDYQISDEVFQWYETSQLDIKEKIDLLIIDGPPGSTQFLARYPAVPLLHQHFSDKVLIVLDDANRNHESIIVKKWVRFLEEKKFKVTVTNFSNYEKGMVILEVFRLVKGEH